MKNRSDEGGEEVGRRDDGTRLLEPEMVVVDASPHQRLLHHSSYLDVTMVQSIVGCLQRSTGRVTVRGESQQRHIVQIKMSK